MIAFGKISLIHRHISCLFDRARPSNGVLLFLFAVLVGFLGFFVCFLLFCLLVFFLVGHPCLDLDCVLVHALFRLPKAGIYRTLHNSFNGTNTCYDLARAEAKDGKKALKLIIARLLFQVSTAKSPLAASFSMAGKWGSCSCGTASSFDD